MNQAPRSAGPGYWSILRRYSVALAGLVAVFLGVITVLPVLVSDQWWIRVWDYPRAQVLGLAVALLVLMVAVAIFSRKNQRRVAAILALLAAVIGVQSSKMLPFSAVHEPQVVIAPATNKEGCISVLVVNVQMSNEDVSLVRALIDHVNPDIALILENNQWWSDQLADQSASYEHVLDYPQDNTYGLLFMTRLVTERLETRFLSKPTIPSVLASLQTPAGEPFVFYGVHPKPPKIGQDTDLRDHELILVAHDMRKDGRPSIVAGDLNDVAWSRTTHRFLSIANARDPRVGRGMFATFHADHWFMRWPLDHIFSTPQFALRDLQVLPAVGSDHFPVSATVCLRPSD